MTITLVLAGMCGAVTAENDPARFLPADTGAYVQINRLSVWRSEMAQDPILRQVYDLLPHRRQQQAWQGMQDMLGMSGDEIIDRYLGSRLVIAGPRPGWGQPVTLMMHVKPADSQTLVKKLALEKLEKAGAATVYSTQDNTTRIGVAGPWMTIARSEHEPYMRSILTASRSDPCLADDPQYMTWIGRLPTGASTAKASAFIRGHHSGHTAALALMNEGQRFTIHYAGRVPDADRLFAMIGEADALDLGPLPQSVVAAVTVNLYDKRPAETNAFDRLIAPKTYAKDIIPFIDAPAILFLAAPEGKKVLPVIGLAVKLRDNEGGEQVTRDLQQIIDNAMLVASVNTAAWGTPPILIQNGRHDHHRYHIAEVGAVLANHTKRDELIQVRFSYGQVGQWFVACSSERVFNQCLDAQADPLLRLTADPDFKAMPLNDMKKPILTAFLRGRHAKAHLDTWIQTWRETKPALLDPADAGAGDIEAQVARSVVVASKFFDQCDTITAQFHRGDNDTVVGQVNLLRR